MKKWWLMRGILAWSIPCFLVISFGSTPRPAHSQALINQSNVVLQQPPAADPQAIEETVQGFELYLNKLGTACRQLPEAATQSLRKQLYEHDTPTSKLEQGAAPRAAQQTITPLKLILKGTSQLESYPAAKAALLRAAAKWETIVGTQVALLGGQFAVEVSLDFGPSFFGQTYNSDEVIGNSLIGRLGFVWVVPFAPLYANQATHPHQQRIFAGLPFPIFTDIGQTAVTRATIPQRLAIGFPATANAVENKIGFNANAKFDFDASDGIDADKFDFEALALREFGRVLGFVSNVGDRELNLVPRPGPTGFVYSYPTIWDLYRVYPGVTLEDDTSFGMTTERYDVATRVQLSGREQMMFTGDLEVPLSTGRPDGLGGDGRPAGHWKDDALTGQYIGIMDPTYAPGERGGLTATDLTALGYFAYRVTPDTSILEVASVDDGSREQSLAADTSLFVNRITPARAPYTLQAIRVQFADPTSVAGKPLRLVAFADPARTGQPPAQPTFLVDRTITLQSVPASGLLEVMLPNPPTVTGGDIYVGVQGSAGNLTFANDANGEPRQRSFRSVNNGASFQPLQSLAGAPLNLMVRAALDVKFNASLNAPPEINQLSQTAVLASEELDLLVFGRNFKPQLGAAENANATVVRIDGKPQITKFLSASQLYARISSDELRGKSSVTITAHTPTGNGGLTSNGIVLNVIANSPSPQLTRLEPSQVAAGSATVTVKVFGRDFKTNSIARLNGVARQTVVLNSAVMLMTLPASDLTVPTQAAVTIETPAPGGGLSNAATFTVMTCTYTFSSNSLKLGQSLTGSQLGAFMLETAPACPWTLRSNDSWLELSGQTQGTGRFPLTFRVTNNPTAALRTGTLMVGPQSIKIQQVANMQAVSATSFTAPTAPGAIATLFGVNLSNATQSATTTPLPFALAGTRIRVTDLNANTYDAPLFFVSPSQINFALPDAVFTLGIQMNNQTLPCLLSVIQDDVVVAEGTLELADVVPGFFTANATGQGLPTGVALRVKLDGTQIYEPLGVFDPAVNRYVPRALDLGVTGERVFLILFGTGFRKNSGNAAITVTAGGTRLPVTFAGAQGSLTGLDQLNVELLSSLKGQGAISLQCTINGRSANAVTIMIQ